MKNLARWRGLKALAQDMIEHGSRAVERVQKGTAERTFRALSCISPIAPLVRDIKSIHDSSVSLVHLTIRTVSRSVGTAADAAFDVLERRDDR
jgi:hypothetical protein